MFCGNVIFIFCYFFFQAEDGIRDGTVTGVQTCALPIFINGLTTANQILTAGIIITAFALSLYALTFNLKDRDRKSTRLNSSHSSISYAVFCLKKKKKKKKNKNKKTNKIKT